MPRLVLLKCHWEGVLGVIHCIFVKLSWPSYHMASSNWWCLMALNTYLSQWWLIISEVLRHSPESNFTWDKVSILKTTWLVRVGSGNDLVPNRWQATTWTNAEQDSRRHMASLSHEVGNLWSWYIFSSVNAVVLAYIWFSSIMQNIASLSTLALPTEEREIKCYPIYLVATFWRAIGCTDGIWYNSTYIATSLQN